jgi:hypothetical protein
MSGHPGVARTEEKVRRKYWWRELHADVSNFVRTCDACQRHKANSLLKAGKLQSMPIPEGRWQSVGADLIVKLPKTKEGKDAILVFIDRLTKMVHLVPCKEAGLDARKFTQHFIERVLCPHGMPKEIITDRGRQFNNKFWHALCERLGIQHKMSSAYHPQTNGQTERINRVVAEMLRSYVSAEHMNDWDEWLPLTEFAINNSWQRSIGCTPFFMMYGEHPLTPADLDVHSRVPAAVKTAGDIQRTVKLAKRQWAEAQQRMKEREDGRRREVTYKPASEGFPRPFTRSDSAFRVKGVERQARLSAFQAAGARSTGGSGTLASRPPGGLVGCSDLRKRSQEGGLQASVET